MHLTALCLLALALWACAATLMPMLSAPRPQGHTGGVVIDATEDWSFEAQVIVVGTR